MIGGKKSNRGACAIIDPKTKQLIINKKEIKQVVLNYCKTTLQNDEEEKEFEGKIKEKKEKVIAIVKEKDGEFEANYNTFKYLLSKVKRSGKRNYDFLC